MAVARKTYIWYDGKFVEKHLVPRETPNAPMILPDIQPFESPITREVISSRNKLKAHMRQHGVTHANDYSNEWYEKKSAERHAAMHGQTREDKQQRIEALKHALEKYR